MTSVRVAALFVRTGGVYFDMFNAIDPWDAQRDARNYAGVHPVVAHPPCERWGRLAALTEHLYGYKRGDDGGCFGAALSSVRRFGGVLEHPAHSDAWKAFGIATPPKAGWLQTSDGGWTCQVSQGWYGHPVEKKTWLYAYGMSMPPELIWGPSPRPAAAHRAGGRYLQSGRRRVSERELIDTPLPFRDLLLSIARLQHTSGGQQP